jgi:hypothetical protein
MRFVTFPSLAAAAAAALVLSSATTAQGGHARIWLQTDSAPLLVRGSGFDDNRRVTVRVYLEKGAPLEKVGRSSDTGAVVMRFASAPTGSCGVTGLSARDSLGRAAFWKAPPRLCGTQPADPGQ